MAERRDPYLRPNPVSTAVQRLGTIGAIGRSAMTVAELGAASIAAPVIVATARGLAGGAGQVLPKPSTRPIPRRAQTGRVSGPANTEQYETSPYQDPVAPVTPVAPTAPTPVQSPRIAEADLISTRNEAQSTLRELRLAHRSAYMSGDRTEAMRIARQIESVRQLGAVADRTLRDRRRVTQTPEELAASQAALTQQYQQLREGSLLRARQREANANQLVEQITRSGGTLGGPQLDEARTELQAAMAERAMAESRPQTLDLTTPTPEDIAARESSRRNRMAQGESMVGEALARRGATGSVLPEDVQADRQTAEAIRRAQDQRRIAEAGGGVEARMGELALERAELENRVLAGQVGDAEADQNLRRITRGLETRAVVDEATIQSRPEIAALADQFAGLLPSVSGRSQYADSTQVDSLRATMSQIAALPIEERRVVARRVVSTLIQSDKAQWLSARTRAGNTDLFDRTWGALGNAISGGSVSQKGENTQSVINLFVSEINRLANAR